MFLVEKGGHRFVPVHEILDEKDAEEILGSMKLKRENLPKISVEDPQIQGIGAKPGQVIKISRNDYGKKYPYYRLVVE